MLQIIMTSQSQYTRKYNRNNDRFDVTNEAHLFGFNCTVLLSFAVFNQYVEWTHEDSNRKQVKDSQSDRLKRLLNIAAQRAKNEKLNAFYFTIHQVLKEGPSKLQTPVTLMFIFYTDDSGHSCVVIKNINEEDHNTFH